ncbi:MAG: polyprenyl synthetase family protein [Candidatus Omnitrophica bacterium]|nr:polyprenyl synthetase family protein [Candidatus Omnitrophota bacterium]
MNKYKKIIDKNIEKYLNEFEDRKNPLFKAMYYSLFPGGKRIRPVLALETCKMCGESFSKAMPGACAVEVIHNFSLVHDDLPCMDNDDYRRGKLTVHKKFGTANAVLAGDALLIFAFALLKNIKDKIVMSRTLGQMTLCSGSFGMIGGQAYDVKYEGKKKTEGLRKKINYLKTAELFILSVQVGAIAAKADQEQFKHISEYGRAFGEAFQIRDDIQDNEYADKEKTRQMKCLDKYIMRAKQTLDIFGKKADNLKALVEKLKEV